MSEVTVKANTQTMMLTRKATAKDVEMKLKQALLDLKAARDLNSQLLQEREDSEKEIIKTIEKNSELKSELADLHLKYIDVAHNCSRMQDTITSFTECNNTHEQALNRINDLEISLCEAQKSVLKLENENIFNSKGNHSQSLFDELLDCSSDIIDNQSYGNILVNNSQCSFAEVTESSLNINETSAGNGDLASNKSLCKNVHNFGSVKKLKKYIKIKRYISRTQKLVNRQNHLQKHMKLRKERILLINKLKLFNDSTIKRNNEHNRDSHDIMSKIENLDKSLKFIYDSIKDLSHKHLNYQIVAANDMVDMCNFNAERFESLSKKRTCCLNDHSFKTGMSGSPALGKQKHDIGRSDTLTCHYDSKCTLDHSAQTVDSQSSMISSVVAKPEYIIHQPNYQGNRDSSPHTLVFTDEIGKDFSAILNNKLRGSVFNKCMPGASLQQIVTAVCSAKVNKNTSIVLFVGNSLALQTKDIIDSFTQLTQIDCKKLTWCTFPYSKSLHDNQNNKIYKLNNMIHHMISRHSSDFKLFDSNLFIKTFYLTKDKMYLARRCRHNVATLLANNINLVCSDKTVTNSSTTKGTEANSFLGV